MRELVARAEQVTDLLEREPHPLRGVNHRQPPKHLLAIPALPADTFRLGQQPARLVKADPRRTHAGSLRHLTNRHLRRHFIHSPGSLDFNPTSKASLLAWSIRQQPT